MKYFCFFLFFIIFSFNVNADNAQADSAQVIAELKWDSSGFNGDSYGKVFSAFSTNSHQDVINQYDNLQNYLKKYDSLSASKEDNCDDCNLEFLKNRDFLVEIRRYLNAHKFPVDGGSLTEAQAKGLIQDTKFALFKILKKWDDDKALSYISLEDAVDYKNCRASDADNECSAMLKKLNDQRTAEEMLVKKELTVVNQQILRGINRSDNIKQREKLEKRLIAINPDNRFENDESINVSIDTFKKYPTITGRFYAGGQYNSTKNIDYELTPNIGFFYYRQPYTAGVQNINKNLFSFSRLHYSIDVGVSSLVIDEKPNNEKQKNKPSIRTDLMWFYNLQQFNADKDRPLYFGLVTHMELNGVKKSSDNKEKEKFYLHKQGWLGLRAAFSPEQYSELLVGDTIRKGGDHDENAKTRVRLNMFMTTPFIYDQSKIQLGLTWDFRLRKEGKDSRDNAVMLTARYNTSFGRLFNNVFK